MSENMKRRLAVLEAFAQSKPTEFDAFVLRWEQANPQQLAKASAIIEKPTDKVKEEEPAEETVKPVPIHRRKLGES